MSSPVPPRPRSTTAVDRGYMPVMINFHSKAAGGANAISFPEISSSVLSRPNTRQTKRHGLLKQVGSDGCRDVMSLTMSFFFLCESVAFSLPDLHHPHRNHIYHNFYIYSRTVGPEATLQRSGLSFFPASTAPEKASCSIEHPNPRSSLSTAASAKALAPDSYAEGYLPISTKLGTQSESLGTARCKGPPSS